MTIHYVSYFERPWRNERNVAEALQWHGYPVECYQITDPCDRPGQNGAPAIEQGDIIFTSAPAQFGLDDMKRWHDQGAKLACWYFDWLWGLGNREELYVPRLKLMDMIFSTDGSDSAEYEKRGISCRHWLPQAAMPEDRLLTPRWGTPQHDVVFMGHIYTDERREIARRLAARWDFAHYGGGGEAHRIWGYEMTSICQNAAIMIGTNYRNDVPGYWSDRRYVVMGAGGFYLGQHVPGTDAQFKDGVHCGFYDGMADMERKVKYWLEHSAERERCRRAGWRLVHERHTYTHRVGEMLAVLRRREMVK